MPRLLLVETSTTVSGLVAIAEDAVVRGLRRLDDSRRNARDLAPAVRELLDEAGWKPRDVDAVIVSRGPGSYTGLRVGVMSAKTFAYATGCAVIGVDTLAAIAFRAPAAVNRVDVLADAQQDKVYVQRFERLGDDWQPLAPLLIHRFAQWLTDRDAAASVTGPGLRKWESKLPPDVPRVDSSLWDPDAESLLRLGLQRFLAGERDDVWALEPLYLRPSSAEEQWNALRRP
jgi:tRNA threonylcarbamoyladenosine biosynthesis protein TsaB